HRFAMIALATEQDQNLRVSSVELDAPEFPYAVETIERMKNVSERLFFLIGADSWAEISTWHEWRKLLKMCDVIAVRAPGHGLGLNVDSALADLVDLRDADQAGVTKLIELERKPRVFITNVAMVDISATQIRAAVRSNELDKLKAMVPPAVA